MRIENGSRGTQPLRARQSDALADPSLNPSVHGPRQSADLQVQGASELSALFAAVFPVPSLIVRGLFELVSKGALQAATASQLEREHKTPDELLEGARQLLPFVAPFGPAALAVMGVVVGLLETARSIKDLVDSPVQRRTVSERLPCELAKALGAGRSPEFRSALTEYLTRGALSPRSFEQLGPRQIGELFDVLQANLADISRLLPEGSALLEEGVQAGQQASAMRPPSHQAFQQAYERKLAPASRAYLRGTSTFAATGELGENGRSGSGRFGWQGQVEGRAEVDFGLPGGQGSAYVEGEASAFVGGRGSFQAGADGIKASGTLGAMASVEAGAGLRMEQSTLGGALSASSELEVRVKAAAAAQVDVDAMVGFDANGNFQAYADVDARIMAELEAEAQGQNTINIFGFKITTTAFVKAQAAAGAEASGGLGYKNGRLYMGGSAGIGVGAGLEAGAGFSIELPDWAQKGVNWIMGFFGRPEPAKLEAPASSEARLT